VLSQRDSTPDDEARRLRSDPRDPSLRIGSRQEKGRLDAIEIDANDGSVIRQVDLTGEERLPPLRSRFVPRPGEPT